MQTDALLTIAVTAVAVLIALPLVVLATECVIALYPRRERGAAVSRSPGTRCDVLVPAHNEAAVIAATLASIRAELAEGDRLWVVADNCSDRTADIARLAGARVIERQDDLRRGKGYALDCGLAAMREAGLREVVVVVDADCLLEPGTLDLLALRACTSGRPVQACYLMRAPNDESAGPLISQFAVTVKNLVRPLALSRLGAPCLLTGSGMAFRADLVPRLRLAHGHIVEDMQLGLELAEAGLPPLFCPEAVVRSPLPAAGDSARSQRTRWEHGHLEMLVHWVPRLLWTSTRRTRPGLALLAFDLAVPPLSLLAAITSLGGAALLLYAVVSRDWLPFGICAASAAAALAGLCLVWFQHERHTVRPKTLLRIPGYVVGKLPIYARFLRQPQQEWVRTSRDQM